MRLRNQASKLSKAAESPCAATGSHATVWAPSRGTYLTDETALYRVANALSSKGRLFLELEDCGTLELILCPACTVARRGLSTVTPTLAT